MSHVCVYIYIHIVSQKCKTTDSIGWHKYFIVFPQADPRAVSISNLHVINHPQAITFSWGFNLKNPGRFLVPSHKNKGTTGHFYSWVTPTLDTIIHNIIDTSNSSLINTNSNNMYTYRSLEQR